MKTQWDRYSSGIFGVGIDVDKAARAVKAVGRRHEIWAIQPDPPIARALALSMSSSSIASRARCGDAPA